MIESMQLSMYQDVRAGKLSGGNKRKVNVGISLTGNNLIQFYDEPSSGLDPIGIFNFFIFLAKRFLWNTI